MPVSRLPEDEVIEQHWRTTSDRDIGKMIGWSRQRVERRREKLGLNKGQGRLAVVPGEEAAQPDALPRDEFTRSGNAEAEHLASSSTRIRTVDELLDYAEVDRNVWEVERFVVNKYEMGAKDERGRIRVEPLYQIKVWLKRNRSAERIISLADAVVERMERHAPRYVLPALPNLGPEEKFLFELCAMDAHLGKLAWAAETGEDYDLRIARERVMDALEDLIHKARGFPIEGSVVPIGNDLLQIDSAAGTTTSGTSVDTDSRYMKAFEYAEQLTVYTLDRLSALGWVQGKIIPGNHDRQSSLTLGRVLSAWYRNHPGVEIDSSPRLRKYVRYGVSLIGYTHGSDEKPADLPLIMATEVPDLWAETLHHEWHTGHFHKSKETRYTAGDSFNGVRVKIIPALCSPDAWHYQKGYVGERKAAEAYLWGQRTGYAGHFSSNVLPERAA